MTKLLKLSTLTFFSLLITSCGGLDFLFSSKEQRRPKISFTEKNYCPQMQFPQWAIDSSAIHEILKNPRLLNRMNQYSNYEKVASLALLYALVRPDVITSSSSIEFITYNGQKIHYYRLSPNDEQSIFVALDQFLRQNRQTPLLPIARQLDLLLPSYISIDLKLEVFLKENKKIIRSSPLISSVFIKGNDSLRYGETFENYTLTKLIESLHINQHSQNQFNKIQQEYTINSTNKNENICSFSKEEMLITPEVQETHTQFSWSSNSQNAILGVIKTNSTKIHATNSFQLLSQGKTSQSEFCYLRAKKNQFLLLSTHPRAARQLLVETLKHDLDQIQNPQDFLALKNKARIIQLTHPDRMIFEKFRADRNLISGLNQKRTPLYFEKRIGRLQSFVHIGQQENDEFFTGIMTDERYPTEISCQE